MAESEIPEKKKPKKIIADTSNMGRPRIFDDEKFQKLKEICKLGASLEDCASFFECGTTTLFDEIRQRTGLTFRKFRDEQLVHTKLRLVQKALIEADKGNTKLLTLCLKNFAGFKERQETVSKNLNVNVDVQEESAAFKKVKKALLGEDSEVNQIREVKPIRVKAGQDVNGNAQDGRVSSGDEQQDG